MSAAAPIVSLEGRTIVVTGAGQGIGKALVELSIALGANVVALDLNAETLQAALAPLPQERVLAVVGSVVDADLAAQAVADAVARFGAVHGLVNNAGITRPAMIDKMTARQWQDVIDVHLTGTFFWTQAVGRHMLERARGGDRTGGSIVNISSDAGRKGSVGQINYAAAKAGMLGMTRALAIEVGGHGITVNCVGPGWIQTASSSEAEIVAGRHTPVGRPGTPAEVGHAALFLAGEEASYITGQMLVVDGGNIIQEYKGGA